jgi:hypothetical protein
MQTKPQPTPAILGQEFIDTTLLTTHPKCADHIPHKHKSKTRKKIHHNTTHTQTQSLKSSGQSLIIYNQSTSQLGFSISPLMSTLTKYGLKANGKPIQVLKSQVKENTRQLETSKDKSMLQPKTLGTKGSTKATTNEKSTKNHKSYMQSIAHHHQIKVHINLIFPNFSPLMSVLTT